MINTRHNKALIAIYDEYMRAINELKNRLEQIPEQTFVQIKDPYTQDPDCSSIQNIVRHVVRSGYTYNNYINTFSTQTWNEYKTPIDNSKVALSELDKMMSYTLSTLQSIDHFSDEDIAEKQIKTRWGVNYDIEQLLEHAIVHILRHRRQIENFLKLS